MLTNERVSWPSPILNYLCHLSQNDPPAQETPPTYDLAGFQNSLIRNPTFSPAKTCRLPTESSSPSAAVRMCSLQMYYPNAKIQSKQQNQCEQMKNLI